MACREESFNAIFTFKENRSKLTLNNNNKVRSVKIKVDGCEFQDQAFKRCDYLLSTEELDIFIELKGVNIETGLKQIESTIKLYPSDKKKHSYIICTRSPLTSTKIQDLMLKMKIKYNCDLKVKSTGHVDSY